MDFVVRNSVLTSLSAVPIAARRSVASPLLPRRLMRLTAAHGQVNRLEFNAHKLLPPLRTCPSSSPPSLTRGVCVCVGFNEVNGGSRGVPPIIHALRPALRSPVSGLWLLKDPNGWPPLGWQQKDELQKV